MRRMPIGISDFRELRDSGCCYMDRSRLIDDILRSEEKARVITRPRGFGKTLNLSMLDAYLNVEYADEPDRFEHLEISGIRPDDPRKNSERVVRLDLGGLDVSSFKKFKSSYGDRIAGILGGFPELEGSGRLSVPLKAQHSKLVDGKGDRDDLARSLMDICRMIESHHGRKPIVLIDDCDAPLRDTCGDPKLNEKVAQFLYDALGCALQGNPSLGSAVVTGVTGFSSARFSPALNGVAEHGVRSGMYAGMYGFTEAEVKGLLAGSGHPEKMDEAREWYGGCLIGVTETFDPRGIVCYAERGFEPGTAVPEMDPVVPGLLRRTDEQTWRHLKTLFSGGSVPLDRLKGATYCDPMPGSAFPIMAHAGHLSAACGRDGCTATVPNRRMLATLSRLTEERFGEDAGDAMEDLIDALGSGDAGRAETAIGTSMIAIGERIQRSELPFEAFAVGLMACAMGRYEVRIDHDIREDYAIIVMKTSEGPDILAEMRQLVVAGDGMTPDRLARSALDHVRYARHKLDPDRDAILYGVCLDGRAPTVANDRCPEE